MVSCKFVLYFALMSALIAPATALDCPSCIDSAKQLEMKIEKIIAEAATFAVCADVCGKFDNKFEVAACNLACNYFGFDEFLGFLLRFKFDSIFFCELVFACPVHLFGHGEISNISVNDPVWTLENFEFEAEFNITRATGTGEVIVYIQPPFASVPLMTKNYLNEGFSVGVHTQKFTVNPESERWQAGGPYKVEVQLCEGTCGAPDWLPFTKMLDTKSTAFYTKGAATDAKITVNTPVLTQEDLKFTGEFNVTSPTSYGEVIVTILPPLKTLSPLTHTFRSGGYSVGPQTVSFSVDTASEGWQAGGPYTVDMQICEGSCDYIDTPGNYVLDKSTGSFYTKGAAEITNLIGMFNITNPDIYNYAAQVKIESPMENIEALFNIKQYGSDDTLVVNIAKSFLQNARSLGVHSFIFSESPKFISYGEYEFSLEICQGKCDADGPFNNTITSATVHLEPFSPGP